MAGQHTSVPRWDVTPPDPDATGRSFAVASFGPANTNDALQSASAAPREANALSGSAHEVARDWVARLVEGHHPVWTHRAVRADGAALAALRAHMGTATVGWRLMLAGPEVDVLAGRAEAIAAGAIPTEIRCFVTSAADKRVHCPHCRELTMTTRPVGQVVECDRCGRTLHIYYHVSRRLGAYLGFMDDAEEMP